MVMLGVQEEGTMTELVGPGLLIEVDEVGAR
jgi:hypothetical protein